MCKQNQESIHHVFLQCEFARMLWFKMFREFGVALNVPDNILNLLNGCSYARWSTKVKKLWVCAVWAVLWGIWIERNARVFSDVYDSVHNLWDKILYWVAIWIKNHKDFRHISLSDLSMGWSFLL